MSEKSEVALIPCSTYEKDAVYQALGEGIRLLGGMEKFAVPGEKIVVKPNFLKKAEPEKAVMTHPSVIEGFCRLLFEKGHERIVVGDSCGHGTTTKVLSGLKLEESLQKYGAEVRDFTDGGNFAWECGKQAKSFRLAKEIQEADAVISLAKMKTHALERITGAVKNSYGFIYGMYKAKGHTVYPNADSFARMLVDLNQCVAPRLYVLDGIVAMEGNGPGSGDPIAMNVLLLSKDPVALDSVFCHLVHLRPELVPTNDHGERMGLGTWKREQIRVLTLGGEISMSEAVKKYGNPGFQVDRRPVKKGIWTNLAGVLQTFQKKPRIVPDKCVKCGICVQSCPVEGKAISFKKGKNEPPVYDYSKCIRCFCCQEMCPRKAIIVK
ncbi:MAG: DUF362 domain-containing protein [Eubacteriales bacterium]|nr:DUF362 domain-containing protein [Eubacteriales bacterium]